MCLCVSVCEYRCVSVCICVSVCMYVGVSVSVCVMCACTFVSDVCPCTSPSAQTQKGEVKSQECALLSARGVLARPRRLARSGSWKEIPI